MTTLPNPAGQATALTSSTTPVKQNSQGSDRFAIARRKVDADTVKFEMAEELSSQWVGPMPVDKFTSEFLPLSEDTLRAMPVFSADIFAGLVDEAYENNMYDPFIKVVKKSKAMPGFKLINTSPHSDIDAITGMKNKPDVSCYLNSIKVDERPTKFEDVELVFELKPSRATADPFDDNPRTAFEAKSKDVEVHNIREKCRGQLACYARVWCARQHRIHCFIIWMGDPHARIIRVDRSGGIVSAKFNYRTHGDLLMRFLWRFCSSTDQARGNDPTVTKASKEETERAMKALYEWRPTSERSVFKVEIPNSEDDKKAQHVFIWGPLADPRSVTGRATRAYPALDPLGNKGEGSVVFLKDSWRSCEDGMEKEFDIIKDLNAKQCRNVPKLICGDDLPEQFTLTKRFAKESWNIGGRPENIVKRVHTRFAHDFVGYHLENFKSSREFIQAVFDAVLAHKDAFEKCGILHRDISAGNILMRKGGGGILNDWDLAERINRELISRQPFRSGTWQFMSAALLRRPGKINTVQDDLESFFWLVLYHTLRYMKHNHVNDVRSIMGTIFDEEHEGGLGQPPCGGLGKTTLFHTGDPLQPGLTVHENGPMTQVIKVMQKHWRSWHLRVFEYDAEISEFMELRRTSREEAIKHVVFDDGNLAMENHEGLVSALDAALAMASWPKGDEAMDLLPLQTVKRSLAEISEDSKTENVSNNGYPHKNSNVPSSKTTLKRTKTSKKLDDNATYRPSGSSLSRPQVLFSDTREPRERNGEVNYEESDVE